MVSLGRGALAQVLVPRQRQHCTAGRGGAQQARWRVQTHVSKAWLSGEPGGPDMQPAGGGPSTRCCGSPTCLRVLPRAHKLARCVLHQAGHGAAQHQPLPPPVLGPRSRERLACHLHALRDGRRQQGAAGWAAGWAAVVATEPARRQRQDAGQRPRASGPGCCSPAAPNTQRPASPAAPP